MSTVITHCDLQSPLTGSIFNPSLQDNKPRVTYLHIWLMCFGNYALTSPPCPLSPQSAICWIYLKEVCLYSSEKLLYLPEKSSARYKGSFTLLRPQTSRKTRRSFTCSVCKPGEKPDAVSGSISNQCIINIATTLRNNESNTSHKVMKKMRQEWLISLRNCLIIVAHFCRERVWLHSNQPAIRLCNHKSQ